MGKWKIENWKNWNIEKHEHFGNCGAQREEPFANHKNHEKFGAHGKKHEHFGNCGTHKEEFKQHKKEHFAAHGKKHVIEPFQGNLFATV